MKKILILWVVLVSFLACSKEPVPCDVSSYIGTWKAKDVICSTTGIQEIVIEQGPNPSQIKMALGTDTLVFTVLGCRATHNTEDIGVARKANMELVDDEIQFEMQQRALFFWQFCNITLAHKK